MEIEAACCADVDGEATLCDIPPSRLINGSASMVPVSLQDFVLER